MESGIRASRLLFFFTLLAIANLAYADMASLETLQSIMQSRPIEVIHDFPTKQVVDKKIVTYHDQTNQPRVISNTTLMQPVKITNSVLRKLYMRNSILQDITYLNENTLNGKFTIYLSEFVKPIDIKHTTIHDYFSIYNSLFDDRFNLSFSRINGSAWISSNQFRGNSLFLNTTFLQDSHILNSIFEKELNFSYATFNGGMEFDHNTFNDHVILDGAYINQSLSFHNSIFYKELSLNNTLLPKYVDLSGLTIKGKPINLYNAKPNVPREKIYINILNTDLSKIEFNYINYRLFFPKETSHQQKLHVYLLLLNKYDKSGMTRSYEALFREFREYQLLQKNQYIMNYIDKYWWDYGLHKEVIYFWFLALFILLTLINCFFYDKLVSKYFNIHFLKKTKPSVICQINPVLHYMYNIPRATLLTLFFVFATFLQVLTNEDRIFKSDQFLINAYVIIINCLGYVFILFVFDSILSQT
jgi:hypothetical protein